MQDAVDSFWDSSPEGRIIVDVVCAMYQMNPSWHLDCKESPKRWAQPHLGLVGVHSQDPVVIYQGERKEPSGPDGAHHAWHPCP